MAFCRIADGNQDEGKNRSEIIYRVFQRSAFMMARMFLYCSMLFILSGCRTKSASIQTPIIYGTFCGYNGGVLKERERIEEWIKDVRILEIDQWLISPDGAKKAYAIEALLRLSTSEKITLSDEDCWIIKNAMQHNFEVAVCNGCLLSSMHLMEALPVALTSEYVLDCFVPVE